MKKFMGFVVFASITWAGCGSSMMQKNAVVLPQELSLRSRLFAPAAPVEKDAAAVKDVSIVGLWNITFMSEGQIVDQGFDAWHADGTETLNDTPAPSTGNVCLGVWSQTDKGGYKLYHPSWTYDAGGNLTGTAVIREQVTVDPSGNQFRGTFTVDVFDLNGNTLFHLAGQLTAQRITVN